MRTRRAAVSMPSITLTACALGSVDMRPLEPLPRPKAAPPPQVNDMVSEAISNFDGKIYYDGFIKIMLAN